MERINSASYLRAIACIAVVLLHAFLESSVDAAASGTISGGEYTAAVTIRTLMMWAVPCFVAVSGSLLLCPERKLTYKKLFGKYILRMIICIVIFSLIFRIADTIAESGSLSFSAVTDGLLDALRGKGWKHMWYLYLMTALYLTLPFFKSVSSKLDRNDSIYLLLLGLIFLTVIPTAEGLIGSKAGFYICIYTVYPLYFLGGYILSRRLVSISSAILLIIFIITTALMVVIPIMSCSGFKALGAQMSRYSFTVTALQSLSLFGLVIRFRGKLPRVLHIALMEIDKCSFGVYLIHLFFFKALFEWIGFDPYTHGGSVTVFACAAAVLVLSYVLIRLLKLIPGVRKII